ncbi:MAG: hypothetical protein WCH84_00330 [Verrucomicrobiota bacterium]
MKTPFKYFALTLVTIFLSFSVFAQSGTLAVKSDDTTPGVLRLTVTYRNMRPAPLSCKIKIWAADHEDADGKKQRRSYYYNNEDTCFDSKKWNGQLEPMKMTTVMHQFGCPSLNGSRKSKSEKQDIRFIVLVTDSNDNVLGVKASEPSLEVPFQELMRANKIK